MESGPFGYDPNPGQSTPCRHAENPWGACIFQMPPFISRPTETELRTKRIFGKTEPPRVEHVMNSSTINILPEKG